MLVHGYPQSHVMWHKVAPRLAERFTVVVPDLRGYGASSKPPTDANHMPYSKRAMALDLVDVMTALGFDKFAIAGHDRGGRVTYRLALDHPDRVTRVAVLDIMPTIEQFERMDRNGARRAYHWYFLTQPTPFPETLIGKDPDYYLDHTLQSWCATPGAFTPEALAAYHEAFRDPAVTMPLARTIARASDATVRSTTPIVKPAAKSRRHSSPFGVLPAAPTSALKCSTYGANGLTTFAASRSIVATSSPKRRQSRLPAA